MSKPPVIDGAINDHEWREATATNIYALVKAESEEPRQALALAARIDTQAPEQRAVLTGYSLRFHKRSDDGSGKCDAFLTGDRRALRPVLAIGVALAVPWVARSVILTGYPVYPLEILGLPVDWKVPAEQVRFEAEWARSQIGSMDV